MEQDISENINQFSEMTNHKCIVKSNLCRICATSVDRMCGIFSLEGHAKNLSHKINVHLPFKVTEQDILPLNCCYDCISILSAWHKFFLKSVDANNKLQEVFTEKSFIPKISNISPNSDSNRPCTEINPSSLLILGPDSKSTFDKNQCNTEKTNYSKSSEQQPFCNSEDNLEDLFNLKCEFGKIPKCFPNNNVSDVSDILLIELKEEVDTQTQFNKPENSEILHHPNEVGSKSTNKSNLQQDQPVTLVDNLDAPKEGEESKKLKKKKNNRERREKRNVKTKKKKMRDKFEEEEEEEEEDDPQELLNYYESSYSEEEMIIDHIRRAHPENKIPEKKSILSKLKRQKQKKLDHEALIASKVTVEGRVYYNCNICGKNLHSPYTFIWHRRIHSGEKPYVCDLCGKQFRVSQGLIRHLRETHEGVKNFGCDICGRMFATKRNVEEHRRIHTNERPYVCAHCGKAFRQKASLYVHNRSHSDTYPYKCTYCDLMFRSKPPMLVHITRHTGEKPYPCDVCGRRFRIKYELKKHALIHSDEKPYSCAECGTSFRQKRVFIEDLSPSNSEEINPKTVKKLNPKCQNETDSIPEKKTNIYHKVFCKEKFKRSNSFTCDICQIECTDKLKLVSHLRSNHGIPVKKHRGKKDEISAKFQCEICGKKFTRKSDANRHKRLKHPEKQPFNSTIVTTNKETILKSKITINDQTFYKCESCSYLSNKSGNLIRHLTVHSDVFDFCCHICGKNFRMLSALTRHIDLQHHGIKKYSCETCGTKFSSKYSLNEHTNIHLNFKPFVCDICGKSFRHSGTLRGHKLFHTDKCPFRCNYCEKKFRRMADLKTHETMHSGYKKHCCHLCGTPFRLRQALKKHLSVHDKFDESTCQECGLKFGQEKYLKAHQRSHKNLTH